MAWTSEDIVYVDVGDAINHGDTVVSRLDVHIEDVDIAGSAEVDAVCVDAFCRGKEFELCERQVLALQRRHMEEVAVFARYSRYDSVGDRLES